MADTKTVVDKFYTLSDISAGIRDAIHGRFGERPLWIVAEISDLNVRKGHCYLSLVEKLPGSAAAVCELKGIIWADKFVKISNEFEQATSMKLASNTSILFRAVVRYDVKWGLSLIIEDIEPKYTVGLLAKERERTIARLKQEGIYSNNKKVTFPLVPQRIAVISAKDSRGFEDFYIKLQENPFGYHFSVTLFPSLLQGDRASGQMVAQLINIFNRIGEFDVVVIVRGGGGSIDLNCFNDYNLSRAVARFPLPVLTGIGHTTNISVVDEVAYADRITPTDAADFLIESIAEFDGLLNEYLNRIHDLYLDVQTAEQTRLLNLFSVLKLHYRRFSESTRKKLQEHVFGLRYQLQQHIRTSDIRLERSLTLIRSGSLKLIKNENECLNELMLQISKVPDELIQELDKKIKQLESSVRHLDPKEVLKRGYSITRLNNQAVRNSSMLKKGAIIKTQFYEGSIESEVK
jgi:exodeoxyribonuclease VII large subunit